MFRDEGREIDLRWRNNDRVSSVDTNRIKVFHVADSDAIVFIVSEYFILKFFPAIE